MPRKPRTRALERVIYRVYQRTQRALSQEEFQLGTITLRFLALIRKGETATLDAASIEAFGCVFGVWRERNLERHSRLAWELAACVPDYDPTVESASILRGPPAAKGTLHPMPAQAGSSLKKSVLPMPLPSTGTNGE